METQELIQIDQIEANYLPELVGWKEKQENIVEENPFIEIIDNKTFEEAKSRRTALVKGRTTIEKQDKLIASKIRDFRNKVSVASQELILITLPFETKQQEEVRHYEEIKANEKAEKERLEEERKQKIRSNIASIFNYWSEVIKESTFQSFHKDKELFHEKVETTNTDPFEEFELDFAEKLQSLKNMFSDKCEQLEYAENQRLEDVRLKAEREKFEKDQADAREKEGEEAEKRKEAQDKIDAENKKTADELAKKEKEIQDEKDRLNRIESDRIAKEEKAREVEDEKKQKEAKSKRFEALKPDVEKLTSIIKAIQIPTSKIPDLKEEVSKKFLKEIQTRIVEFQEDLLAELGTIK